MQARRYIGLRSLPAHLKEKARQRLREKWDREATEREAKKVLLSFLEAICSAHDKEMALGYLRAELGAWKGDCPAPSDGNFARALVRELEAAILRLEATESISAFLASERRD